MSPKTAEIIVDEEPWRKKEDTATVLVTIGFNELDLRKAVKEAGGRWIPAKTMGTAPVDSCQIEPG